MLTVTVAGGKGLGGEAWGGLMLYKQLKGDFWLPARFPLL